MSGFMNQKRIFFPGKDLILKGIFSLPEGQGPFGLVVVCHPHPLYGGSMDNKVVDAVCRKVGEEGLAWLKFNFRGVGRSEGQLAGGTGEKEDAKAAISFGANQTKVDPERIGICGYSFGSIVAFSVSVEDPRIKAVAGISPFVQLPDLLAQYRKPKLLISGTNDEFIDPQTLRQIFQKLPDPKELAIYPEVDHFWGGQEDAMAERVSRFFKKSFEFKTRNP